MKCKNCKYYKLGFKGNENISGYGYCKRFPTPVEIMHADMLPKNAKVLASDWCGEFVKRPK